MDSYHILSLIIDLGSSRIIFSLKIFIILAQRPENDFSFAKESRVRMLDFLLTDFPLRIVLDNKNKH